VCVLGRRLAPFRSHIAYDCVKTINTHRQKTTTIPPKTMCVCVSFVRVCMCVYGGRVSSEVDVWTIVFFRETRGGSNNTKDKGAH
jgi:hypothetical protein